MSQQNKYSFNFMDSLGRFADLLLASVLCFLLCLPLVTVGPALTALYHTVVKVIRRERGKVLATYFSCFRSNFRQGFLLGLICLGYLVVGLADIYLLQVYGHIHDAVPAFYAITWLYLLPLALVLPWLFSYLSRFTGTVGQILKNAFILSFRNLGTTLLCVILIALGILLGCMLPGIIPLIPGPLCLLLSKRIEPVFRELTLEQPVDHGVDDWYNE